jgi:hypothetical protein
MKALPEGSYSSRCGVYEVALNAPKLDENSSGMQGKRNDVMTTSIHMNPYES